MNRIGCDAQNFRSMNHIGYSVGQSSYSPNSTASMQSRLDHLPYNVIAKIAGYIEPIWLYNLSHVNRKFRRMLSFEGGGNRIWYDSLPAITWGEGERFQDEEELVELAIHRRRNGDLDISKHGLWVQHVIAKRLHGGGNNGSNQNQFVLNQVATTANLNTLVVTAGPSGHFAPVAPTNGHGVILPPSPVHQRFPLSRPKISALGGPYEDIFNYKREIVGRIVSNPVALDDYDVRTRCHVCLAYNNPTFNIYCVRRWGIIWCSICLKKYTITFLQVEHLVGSHELCYYTETLAFFDENNVLTFYRPGLESVLSEWDWPSIDAVNATSRRSQLERYDKPVAFTALEEARREYRHEIVRIAKCLWQGEDPFPVLTEVDGQLVSLRSQLAMDEAYFRKYRERFCPVDKLGSILFPAYKLDPSAHMGADIVEGGWLTDPSIKKIHKVRGQIVDETRDPEYEHTMEAKRMLMDLTSYGHPNYDSRGLGGHVKAWVDAANKYHIERLDAQITSGAIARMETPVPRGLRSEVFDRLHRTRQKTGLEDSNGNCLKPHVRRPNYKARYKGNLRFMMRLEQEYLKTKRDYAEKIKTFNKIVRADCAVCPTGAGVFNPRGIEGFLDHVRQSHPELFWATDDFTIVG